jgi:hypothetical protein
MSEHRHHLNLIELSALSAIVRLSGDMQKPEIVGLILLAGALIILGAFFGLVAIGAFETQRSAARIISDHLGQKLRPTPSSRLRPL